MADKKITELPAATALDTDDLFPVVEDGTTVKATVAQVTTIVTAGSVANTLVAAKGDLVGATANDTPAIVTVGADRTYLRSDSNASTGVRWGLDLIRTRSTFWHYNGHLNTPASVAWPILGRAYHVPWWLPGRNVITAVGINVTAAGNAGNVIRIGIYSDNGSGAPGTILDQGTVAGDAIAFATWTPSSPVAVTDYFWIGACPQGTSTIGSTWLSMFNPWGMAQDTARESGAAWAGTYVSATGPSRYSTEAGTFASNPTLTFEVQNRNPYMAVRLQ